MNLETHAGDGYVVVTPGDEAVDVTNAVDFKTGLVNLARASSGHLVLDLQPVTFMDSSGLGAIVSCLKALGRQGELVLCCVQPEVASLLELTRMNRVLRIEADVDTAVASLT